MNINWDDLTLSNFQQWPDLVKYFALALLCFAVTMVYYFASLSTNLYQYKLLISEEKNLKAEFEAKHKLVNFAGQNEQRLVLEKIYQDRVGRLVKNNEISALLNEISQAASSIGLVVELFAPKTESKNEFPKELSLSMSLVGEYQNIVLFLSKTAALNRLIVFEEFEINKKESDSKDQELEAAKLLRMKIRMKIEKN